MIEYTTGMNLDGDVVLYFSAPWCTPCQAFAPLIEEVATVQAATVIKVNADDHADLARQFSIRSVPTLIAVRDGKEKKRSVGTIARAELEKFL